VEVLAAAGLAWFWDTASPPGAGRPDQRPATIIFRCDLGKMYKPCAISRRWETPSQKGVCKLRTNSGGCSIPSAAFVMHGCAPAQRSKAQLNSMRFFQLPVPDRPIEGHQFRMSPERLARFRGPAGLANRTITVFDPRFYDPVSGQVRSTARTYVKHSSSLLRNRMSFVLQETVLCIPYSDLAEQRLRQA